MIESKQRGRHRVDGRPSTPLTSLSTALGEHAGDMSRRSAAVAVSTGLILSAGIPLAQADSVAGAQGTAASSLVPEAVVPVATSIMSVPADAEWASPVAQIEVEAAANPDLDAKPKPKPRVTQVSRSAARQSVQATSGAPAQAAVTSEAPASASGSSVIEIASRYQGVPYVYGGSTPESGFDCSGFTSYVFAQLGVQLPRSSSAQRGVGTVVSAADRRPGDLVWYPGHVAIYAGDNTVIDAPQPGGVVRFHQQWRTDVTYIRLV